MLNPHYVSGFIDGEGCFCVSISRKRFRVPEVRLKFEIELRGDDEPILREIKDTLGCGSIYRLKYERYEKWRPHAKYMVGSSKEIREKIIPFFLKYPLQAKKKKQFELFCEVSEMIERGEHKSLEGIDKIRQMKTDFKGTETRWMRETRTSSGVQNCSKLQSPPIRSSKLGMAEVSVSGPKPGSAMRIKL